MQVKVKNVRKCFLNDRGGAIAAVENMSFGLEKGESFGLLGVNGSGKSTIFKLLTAGEEPTDGEINIQGLDMYDDFQEVRKLLGYCPQKDPLFEPLTVE